ncbi:MAG TPA: MmcQ/YjbR family DNA-binding protein [Thermomicrobiales bacterium]
MGRDVPPQPENERRLREICLALPEATEEETWGAPTYRVRGKIFAMQRTDERGLSMWCKAPPGVQELLVNAEPERYFVPPYVGHHGWIGVRLDNGADWDDVEDLITDSYHLTAPKRLVARLSEPA